MKNNPNPTTKEKCICYKNRYALYTGIENKPHCPIHVVLKNTSATCLCPKAGRVLVPEKNVCPVHGDYLKLPDEPEVTDKEDLDKRIEAIIFPNGVDLVKKSAGPYEFELRKIQVQRIKALIARENNKLRVRYNEETRKMEEEHKAEIRELMERIDG